VKRTRTETRWVIVYRRSTSAREGLYSGSAYTRKDAIDQYVRDKGLGLCDNRFIPAHLTGEDIKRGWAYWQKQGDRAVKATITWEESAR
jgi:hypothetical protein